MINSNPVAERRERILEAYKEHFAEERVADSLRLSISGLNREQRELGISLGDIDAARRFYCERIAGYFSKESLIEHVKQFETLEGISDQTGIPLPAIAYSIRKHDVGRSEIESARACGRLLRRGVDRDAILSGIVEHGSVFGFCDARNLSHIDVHKSMRLLGVSRDEMLEARREHRRNECKRGYDDLTIELGRFPEREDFLIDNDKRRILNRINTEYGSLFNFKTQHFLSKERILEGVLRHGSLADYARSIGVHPCSASKVAIESVTYEELEEARAQYRRTECKRLWGELEDKIGHAPTYSDIEQSGSVALYDRIWRNFGSLGAFREWYGIKAPEREIRPPAERVSVSMIGADEVLMDEMAKREVRAVSSRDHDLLDSVAQAMSERGDVDWGESSPGFRRQRILDYVAAKGMAFHRIKDDGVRVFELQSDDEWALRRAQKREELSRSIASDRLEKALRDGFDKETILEGIRECGSLEAFRIESDISEYRMRAMVKDFEITRDEMKLARADFQYGKRVAAEREYKIAALRAGHDLTRDELNFEPELAKIVSQFGGLRRFREEFDIPAPTIDAPYRTQDEIEAMNILGIGF